MSIPASGGGGRRPSAESGLRASDAERDAAVKALGEHLAAGRIDPAEFDERAGRALGARTRGELDGLFADLPALPGPAQAPRRERPAATVYARALIPLVLAAVMLAALLLAGPVGGHQHAALPLLLIVFVLLRRPWRPRRGERPRR